MSKPVAAVLLVAIAFLLATLLAVSTVGVVDSVQEPAPTAMVDIDNGSDHVVVVYRNGDSVSAEQLHVSIDDPDDALESGSWKELGGEASNGRVSAGDRLVLTDADGDERIQLRWLSSDNDTSYQIESWEGGAPPNVVTEIDACTNIDEPGTYELTADISGGPNCLNVTADAVTLDGNGHTVDGGGSTYAGVRVGSTGDRSDVTIENIAIEGFNKGVHMTDTADGTVSNVTATNLFGLGSVGLVIEGTSETTIHDVTVAGAQGGMQLRDGGQNDVSEFDAGGATLYGLTVDNSTQNTIEDVHAVNTMTTAIEFTNDADGNTLVNATANGSTWGSGIAVRDSDDNTIEDSVAADNGNDGFLIENGDNNSLVRDNEARQNGDHGYCDDSGTGNEYNQSENTASGNGDGAYC